LDGYQTIFRSNGSIRSYYKYKKDAKNGPCAEYDENGEIIRIIKYTNNLPDRQVEIEYGRT
jgi:antitoxin component YwqK of YwqJK toxin-antitoxin module